MLSIHSMQMALPRLDGYARFSFYWAETQMGSLPYALWQVDDHYERYRHLAEGRVWSRLPQAQTERIHSRAHWLRFADKISIRTRPRSVTRRVISGAATFTHTADNADFEEAHRCRLRRCAGRRVLRDAGGQCDTVFSLDS